MAYNLESLIKIIEQIIHPYHHHRLWTIDPSKKTEIESLLNKAHALTQLFGNPSSTLTGDKIENLESRIRDAVHEAEDILESHLVDRIRSVGQGVSFTFSPTSLHKVIEEFDSAEEEMKKMMDGSHIPEGSSSPAAAAVSSRIDPNPKKILVGLSQDSIQLKDRLTREEAKLVIIPIVGMGGIGKTTLARNIYDDPLIVSHFETRAWITISQEYNIRVILLGLLDCLTGKLTDEMRQKEKQQLALHLHQSLWGRRYLIVLDDMWDNVAWDDIQTSLPDNKNGSRVIVTTREMSVANYAGPSSSHHKMQLLNEHDSWNLLREKVFAQKTCPRELETIGKRIAENCAGLPLAIHLIGGVLSQAMRTQKSWTQVAKDVISVVTNNDERFSKILSLSYNHLPNHLKPCFLYMSTFPEDYEIQSSKLIRLWVAEGLLKPISDKSLEEAAEMYLKALVGRNLISIRRRETNGIVKSYGMHDLLRDLCVRKASEEKFLYIKNWPVHKLPNDVRQNLRRLSDHSSNSPPQSLSLQARSFIWVVPGQWNRMLPRVLFAMRLLRVLDLLRAVLSEFPEEVLQLVNLRYLALAYSSSILPSSLSNLWNLQTIIFRRITEIEAIHGILGIPHFRHIKFQKTYPFYKLPNGKSFALQENLQTLCGIKVHPGFDGIIESVPNLKKLGIVCSSSLDSDINLACLHKLETLTVERFSRPHLLSFLVFPPSLKKLALRKCMFSVGYMNKIGSCLPDLEVLKLRSCSLESSTWEPTEVEFSGLQFLLLENLYLVEWEVDETHFPRLERLVVRGCSKLEEIPSNIGEIPTLEIIELHYASPSAVASARKIQEEQREWGNYGLQVLVTGSSK